MKRIKNFLIIPLILMVVSCGESSKKANEAKQPSLSINTDSSGSPDNKDSGIDYYKIGEKLMDAESFGNLKIGMKFDEVINIYGQPDTISKPEFSEADGADYQTISYKYKGIDICFMFNADSTREVSWIEISEPCELTTARQIGIGSLIDQVKQAYKDEIDPEYSNSETIIAGSIYLGMFFDFKDNKVKQIYLGAGAE